MRSLCLSQWGKPDSLELETTSVPTPGKRELLIRVHAVGVTPTELLWYPTSFQKSGEHRERAIPGHEFSGVVADAGEEVGSLEAGCAVFGMNDWFANGAMAGYCVAPFEAVAPLPSTLTHEAAASTPISALTAWQGLIDRAKLQPGERVLVHGGAGAVGIFAVQIARWLGARVYTTVSERNAAFVSALGADVVINYRRERFEDAAQGMDVVFDTVGGETFQRSWTVLKPEGRMVTVGVSGRELEEPRANAAFFIVEPNQKQLFRIAGLIDAGVLRAEVDNVVPLEDAAAAFAGKASKMGRGKVVVRIGDGDRVISDVGRFAAPGA